MTSWTAYPRYIKNIKQQCTNLQYCFLEIFYKLCSIIFTASVQRYEYLVIDTCCQTNSVSIVCNHTKQIQVLTRPTRLYCDACIVTIPAITLLPSSSFTSQPPETSATIQI